MHVADASNLERNLYLATQFIELGVPTVIALNMYDMALDRGLKIDIEMLSELLGVPMVPTVGSREEGIDELMALAIEVAREGRKPTKPMRYGRELEAHIAEVSEVLEAAGSVGDLPPRWVATKLLEGDTQVTALTADSLEGSEEILNRVEHIREHLEEVIGDYRTLGVETVLTVRGDEPRDQEEFSPHPDSFDHASDFLRFAKTISDSCFGAACYPEGHIEAVSREADLEHLKQKVDLGAEFLIANYFYDNRSFFDFMDSCTTEGIEVPILPQVHR